MWRRLSESPQQEKQCLDGGGVFGGKKRWKTAVEAWSSPILGRGSVRRRIQVLKTRRELYAGLWIYAGRAEMKCSVAGRYQAEGSPVACPRKPMMLLFSPGLDEAFLRGTGRVVAGRCQVEGSPTSSPRKAIAAPPFPSLTRVRRRYSQRVIISSPAAWSFFWLVPTVVGFEAGPGCRTW
ncbi:hypothetical protein CRENBAI_012598 [Crenichthys baileyi]|uniref:Uncharacterized protein n=1 Tax=Crenichthys baileyi TaxID=28760 RepID=A0AAV9RFF2_9TELE